jgi:8-oxo-dGTP diphosphatase
MDPTVRQLYGNKTRVRVCGLCIQDNQILLVNHAGLREGDFWAPPGGGVEFGETVVEALKREFLEETGLHVAVGDFLFVCELVALPLHAVELFFSVAPTGGTLRTGFDPESGSSQVIRTVQYHAFGDLDDIPADSLHGIFSKHRQKAQIGSLRGYFKL